MQPHAPDDSADRAGAAGRVLFDIRQISASELAQLGVSQLAFVKPVQIEGGNAFAIHAADGTPIGLAPSRDLAVAAVIQHEMVAASVH